MPKIEKTRSLLFSRATASTVWRSLIAPVSLSSQRWLSRSLGWVAFEKAKVVGSEREVSEPAAKNQRRSWTMYPPSVAETRSLRSLSLRRSRFSWKEDSSLHEGFVMSTRTLPASRLPPLLVTAFTTPPLKRPYSAEIAPVRICVSSIASSMKRPTSGGKIDGPLALPKIPKPMSTPSRVMRLS